MPHLRSEESILVCYSTSRVVSQNSTDASNSAESHVQPLSTKYTTSTDVRSAVMTLKILYLLPIYTKFWGILMCFRWMKIIQNKLRKQETVPLTVIIHVAAMRLIAEYLSAYCSTQICKVKVTL